MTSQTMQLVTDPRSKKSPARRSLVRIYALEAKYEFLKVLRMPAFAVPSLAFPILFYVFFGIIFGQQQSGFPMALYLLATYGAFGVMGAALFGFGVGVATERGQGWLQLKRASPMPVGAYFTARIVMATLFGLLIIASLFLLGRFAGGVELAPSVWLGLGAALVAGGLPFCAFGLALGYLAGPNSAPAIVNLIYLPMAFLSGLWIPIMVLPSAIQKFAAFLPAYHYSQLALKVIEKDVGVPIWQHLAYLTIFTVACLLVARFGYRRDEDLTYG